MKNGTKKVIAFSVNDANKRLEENPSYFFDLDFLLLDSKIPPLYGTQNIKNLITKLDDFFDENKNDIVISYTITKNNNDKMIDYDPNYDITRKNKTNNFNNLNLFEGLKSLAKRKIITINNAKITTNNEEEITFKISITYPIKTNFAIFDANNQNRLTVDFETGVYEYKGRKAKIKNGTQPYAILYILSVNKGVPISFDELRKSANELIHNTDNHLNIEKQVADAIRTIRLKVDVKDGEYFPVKKIEGFTEKKYLFEVK